MGKIGANLLLPKALKVAQSPINLPIWSHWLPHLGTSSIYVLPHMGSTYYVLPQLHRPHVNDGLTKGALTLPRYTFHTNAAGRLIRGPEIMCLVLDIVALDGF